LRSPVAQVEGIPPTSHIGKVGDQWELCTGRLISTARWSQRLA